jgi:F0F1-type ATP synthase membrane subunit b/b'
MIRRRTINIFTFSFLDAMACGFGASVLLFFMIIKAAAPDQLRRTQEDTRAEVTAIELDLLDGRELLAQLQNALATTDQELVETKDLSARIVASLRSNEEALASAEQASRSRTDALEKLKADVKAIDQDASKLRDEVKDEGGEAARAFVGQGDRQYLTGLRVGGERILILLDASASMLDETIVNVVRRRNMPDDQKVQSRKWQRALTTVEWRMSQFPLESKFQIYAFNADTKPLVEGTAATWLEVKDTDKLDAMAQAMKKLIPSGGTSLQNAFAAAAAFDPKPDNLLLITDGLPTQADTAPLRKTVSADQRLKLFERAVKVLPTGVPVNTILLPMEGDPRSGSAYWQLAQNTSGSMISPAKDWP